MATAKVEVSAPELSIDATSQALRAIASPDRKRKQRTPYSPDRDINGTSKSRSYGYNSHSPPDHSPEVRHTSAHSSHSATASANDTAGDDGTSSRGGGGEETLTLRRREANRLAAQRFRSRKKGYQDSLEERIRILEDEKDVIARRLDHSHQRTPHEEGYYRQTEPYPHSPDRNGDADVRYASLESANRRLQDELRGVMEDNARLRDEVDRWRKWEREQRDSRSVEKVQHRGPALAPLDFGPMAPPSYTSASHPSPYPPPHPHPPLERGHSYSHSYRSSSPGPRLPPLRILSNGSQHASPNGRPLLPRPESMERISTLHNPRPQTSPANRN
jgi:hypothetical protein